MPLQDISSAGLGVCEHCSSLMSLLDMPQDSIDAIWKCKSCQKVISHISFGYEKVGEKFEKTKWVGPDGKLTSQKPNDDFIIGNWHVRIPI